MEIFVNNVKKIIVVILLLLVSYLLGTTQAKTIVKVNTIEKVRTVIPSNYVCMDDITGFESNDYGLQLYFKDGTGYYWERKQY